jgi:hypothetical protein
MIKKLFFIAKISFSFSMHRTMPIGLVPRCSKVDVVSLASSVVVPTILTVTTITEKDPPGQVTSLPQRSDTICN